MITNVTLNNTVKIIFDAGKVIDTSVSVTVTRLSASRVTCAVDTGLLHCGEMLRLQTQAAAPQECTTIGLD